MLTARWELKWPQNSHRSVFRLAKHENVLKKVNGRTFSDFWESRMSSMVFTRAGHTGLGARTCAFPCV